MMVKVGNCIGRDSGRGCFYRGDGRTELGSLRLAD